MTELQGDDCPVKRIEPAPKADDERALSADTFADPVAFLQTLRTAATAPFGSALKSFDGPGGAPVIVDSNKPACAADNTAGSGSDNKVISTVTSGGKVVREHMQSGPDMVVAYDDQGNAHRFPDEKITTLPVDFSGIPDWRVKQMNATAYELLGKYMVGANPMGGPDGRISFNDIASIMKDISKMDNLTEVEKCRMWSEVRNVMGERKVPILDADEQPEKIDSWKGARDPGHALIVLNDGYHGNRLINMSPEDASKAIRAHEEGAEADDMGFFDSLKWRAAKTVLGTNTGDIEASEGQLRALRELRSQGTFAAYASAWETQFVRSDRDRWGFPK